MKRLDALLSQSGQFSRSEAKKLIFSGKVTVNDTIVRDPSFHVPDGSEIKVFGKAVDCGEFVYILMNKPAGYICSSAEKPSVLELVPKEMFRKDLSCVGRLDKDTEGLLILTNDGAFSHKITSPNKKIYKFYYAELKNPVTEADIDAFAAGLSEGGDDFLPAKLEPCGECAAKVSICEGKYHQVKRMFKAVGNEVLYLKRLSIGDLTLDPTLAPGECRPLTEEEKMCFSS